MATNPHDSVSDRIMVQGRVMAEDRLTWSEWGAQRNPATVRLLIARILLFLFCTGAIALALLILSQRTTMNFRRRGRLFGARLSTALDQGVYCILMEDTALTRVLVHWMSPLPIYIRIARRPNISHLLVPYTPELDALLTDTCAVLADIRRRGSGIAPYISLRIVGHRCPDRHCSPIDRDPESALPAAKEECDLHIPGVGIPNPFRDRVSPWLVRDPVPADDAPLSGARFPRGAARHRHRAIEPEKQGAQLKDALHRQDEASQPRA